MDDIFPVVQALTEAQGKKVLVTILDVNGSAYKKEGSCMLILEEGSTIGVLSGGCLEEDLKIRAQEVCKTGKCLLVIYDLNDEADTLWGYGNGCPGRVTILLEPVTVQLEKDLFKLKDFIETGVPVIGIKELPPGKCQVLNAFIPLNGEVFGIWKEEQEGNLRKNIKEAVSFMKKSGMHLLSGQTTPVFIHTYPPRPRLIVFGAGADSKPLVSLAARIGFYVVVCDWRPSYCTKEKFPDAAEHLAGFPGELAKKLEVQNSDSCVVMSHHFHKDKEFLESICSHHFRYLGIMGTSSRTESLFENRGIPEYIHAPIGLSIGAKGPEEIAVSIVAELIKAYRKDAGEASWVRG
ncbi:XdhC/CoxI family protein [Bacillus sp. FJAT-27251]|uniref:XdhC family protein n=1 Tax=Bacillus sp. FJAT-27251 TaxID=1684142 RepID=UPI0006A776B2|nr:XdhC/CoxI family protein [Bacillus sp. FJAT-27251]